MDLSATSIVSIEFYDRLLSVKRAVTELYDRSSNDGGHQAHREILSKVESMLNQIKIKRSRRPLIVLDLNGVLIDRVYVKDSKSIPTGLIGLSVEGSADPNEKKGESSAKLGNFMVWKRPGLDEFLDALFERCDVAVWSSIKKWNLDEISKFVFGRHEKALKFRWSQEYCDAEPHPDPSVRDTKDLYVKDMAKISTGFPQYDFKNTIMLDDTPEKIRNGTHFRIGTWDRNDTDDKALHQILKEIFVTFDFPLDQ